VPPSLDTILHYHDCDSLIKGAVSSPMIYDFVQQDEPGAFIVSCKKEILSNEVPPHIA
jgi:hypothetical protein